MSVSPSLSDNPWIFQTESFRNFLFELICFVILLEFWSVIVFIEVFAFFAKYEYKLDDSWGLDSLDELFVLNMGLGLDSALNETAAQFKYLLEQGSKDESFMLKIHLELDIGWGQYVYYSLFTFFN